VDPSDQEHVVSLLQDRTLDAVRGFVTKNGMPLLYPMGIWKPKTNCDLTGQKTADQYTGDSRPKWMDNPAAGVTPSSRIYEELPGAAVFNLICINCHGPAADGRGRLADNLLVMTGGSAVVSDLADGLFGPPGKMSGLNRQTADHGFGTLPMGIQAGSNWMSATTDDRAARYLAWMALGGTDLYIPQPVLTLVANTAVLGVKPYIDQREISGNMLTVARATCLALLIPSSNGDQSHTVFNIPWFTPDRNDPRYLSHARQLITSNGAAELWLRLCSLANPPPVRAIRGSDASFNPVTDFYSQSDYGANPVGSQNGPNDPNEQAGISPNNLMPWCIRRSYELDDKAIGPVPPPNYPRCPDSIDVASKSPSHESCQGASNTHCWTAVDENAWAIRGAINAGFAVFLYLDALEKGNIHPVPDYDKCEQLQTRQQ
jgi:hypothetical protein